MSVFHITVTGSSPPNPKGLGTFLLCSGLCHPMPGRGQESTSLSLFIGTSMGLEELLQ